VTTPTIFISSGGPQAHEHSWDDRSHDRAYLRYLRKRNEIFPAGVARVSRCREYALGQTPTFVQAYHISIRAHNENGALFRQLRGAAIFGEVQSGVLTRNVGYGTTIVHVSAYQDNYRLLVIRLLVRHAESASFSEVMKSIKNSSTTLINSGCAASGCHVENLHSS
jgi:hypothetical protein